MTTEQTTPEAIQDEAQPESKGIDAVREAKERADARAEKYRQQLVETNLSQIGLRADEGLGIAVAENFKGEPTVEEIRAFAAEKYKYVYDPAMGTQAVSMNAPSEVYQQTSQVADQVMQQARSAVPDDDQMMAAQRADSRILEAAQNKQPVEMNQIVEGIAAKMKAVRP